MKLVEFTDYLQLNMICLKENAISALWTFFLFLIYNRIFENEFIYSFTYLLTPVYNLLEFISLFITFFIYVFNNII